ncbi:acyl-CoA synthetase [Actinomadura verrucosospora]|uniref:Acyl-CoA synthetase n=1 Tax=Actinomadura verrucosospora TaxID=46165 RepID=A0A7D3ZRD6_ACTVE|nr:acyl-CoA synthetase [Actinomadura verrucosospora]
MVSGDLRVTYAEFDAAVNRAANALAERGLRKGDRLALLSHNCFQYAVLAFATAKLGVVLVPVNFMLNADEIAYILGHSGASGIVAEGALVATAEKALAAAGVQGGVRGRIGGASEGWEDVDGWWREGSAAAPDVLVGDDDPLRLMYTSGTESRPKGVMLTSRSLISQYVSCIVDGEMSADDVEVHALPMYHCAQLDCFFSVDVYLGATSVILPGPDPAPLLETIERERVSKLFCPPTVWISLLRHPDFERRDLSSLRKGYYGASAMPVEVLRELLRRLPDVRLWNFYGQTEMAPLATILRPDEQLERAGSAGRAAINVETMLVDDDGNPVAAGEVGEIVHRSPHAALGYYNDEEKTEDAFRGGWFHSGDLGVMTEDGYLSVVDRKKDMIKTGGENVASREVEEAIYELDGVAEVAVFGIAHPRWIEAVTAVVVAKPGVALGADDVHAHVRERLAGYKRPKYVVMAESLPKNPSGKILKRELRGLHAGLAES